MKANKIKQLGSFLGAFALTTTLFAVGEAATTKKRTPAAKAASKAQPAKSTAAKAQPAASAHVSGFKFEDYGGKVEFLAIGNPGALRVKGTGKGPVGTVSTANNKLNAVLEFDLRSLKTGIDLRDSHMKQKYLDTGTHPMAKLVIKDFALPNESGEASFEAPGQLTLKGVTKSIKCKVESERSSKSAKFDASFRIKLEDFGIDIPKYLGITMAENVDITVKAESNAMQ